MHTKINKMIKKFIRLIKEQIILRENNQYYQLMKIHIVQTAIKIIMKNIFQV